MRPARAREDEVAVLPPTFASGLQRLGALGVRGDAARAVGAAHDLVGGARELRELIDREVHRPRERVRPRDEQDLRAQVVPDAREAALVEVEPREPAAAKAIRSQALADRAGRRRDVERIGPELGQERVLLRDVIGEHGRHTVGGATNLRAFGHVLGEVRGPGIRR